MPMHWSDSATVRGIQPGASRIPADKSNAVTSAGFRQLVVQEEGSSTDLGTVRENKMPPAMRPKTKTSKRPEIFFMTG